MTKELMRTNFLSRVSNTLPVKYAKHASIALISGAALTLYPIPDGITSAVAEATSALGIYSVQGTGVWASYEALSREEVAYCSELIRGIETGKFDSTILDYFADPSVDAQEQLPVLRNLFEGLVKQRIGDKDASTYINVALEEAKEWGYYNAAEGAAELQGDFLKASEFGRLAHPNKAIDYKSDITTGFREFLKYTDETNSDLLKGILDKSM